jgi:hypothetical protein
MPPLFNVEAFLGNVATRNRGQFSFSVRGEQLRWERRLAGRTASGIISLRDDEIMPDFHRRFWDCVMATPWDKTDTEEPA